MTAPALSQQAGGHTPTPWSIDEIDKGFSAHILGAPDGFCADIIGTLNMGYAESKANAALIVRAVNSHAALVGALRSIAEGNLGDAPWQANYDRIRQVARLALQQSEAE